MGKYRTILGQILDFIDEYLELINCHLVDFIADGLWEKCLPLKLRKELEGRANISWTDNDNNPELSNFLKLTKSLSLKFSSSTANLEYLKKIVSQEFGEELEIYRTNATAGNGFMSPKKMHEVEILGTVIGNVARATDSLVVDAGAGKAYLSMYLADNYKIPVLAVDSSQQCHAGAVSRQKKLQRGNKSQPQSLIRYVVEEIKDNTDYTKIVQDSFGDCQPNKNLLITGLHTCGSLAHSVIRTFLNTERIRTLFIVPCCYHLTDETFGDTYKFSKNARMLAQQSVERSSKHENISPVLFYRAVLQVILRAIGVCDAKVGRGGPKGDFVTYANWALSRIGIDTERVPNAVDLENIYRSYAHLKNRFDIFQMLRIHTCPVIEAAIILDRIIYLQQSGKCGKVTTVRVFDPALSPRSYAIFATK